MAWMDTPQRRVLEHLCDTIFPSLPSGQEPADAFSAADARQMGVAEVIERDLARSPARQRDLLRLLKLLEIPVLNGLLAGHWRPFSQLPLDERTAIVNAWQRSRLRSLRQGMRTLQRLILFLVYTLPEPRGEASGAAANPTWTALRYPGFRRRTTDSGLESGPTIETFEPGELRRLDADVLVVGSGAGGGVVAAELAQAGLDVLVAEKGGFYDERSFPGGELAGNLQLYERRGAFPTADGNLLLVAGSNVGGGTTVNWMTSLEPPQEVRHEWDREFGFRAATDGTLQTALDRVRQRMRVTCDESPAVGSNARLERGCRALDYRVQVIPRNVRGCGECDFCMFGCTEGAKQDTRRVFLADAWQRGARILPRAEVRRLRMESGRVAGAELLVPAPGGGRRELQVDCRTVVVAAGAIQTPALLLRSGIRHPQLGRNLHLHPATATLAWYREPVLPWQGPPQARVCDQFADLDGRGYGVRLETCPAHPGTAALGTPWISGSDHKRRMRQLPFTGNVLVLARDRDGGRVTVDGAGRAVVRYRLSRYDARQLLRGTLEALRIQRAAGATHLFSPHEPSLDFAAEDFGATGGASAAATEAAFADYLRRVEQRGIRPGFFALYSAHQLSTCRIAADASRGVVDPRGRVRGRSGLYVADGSLLPSACGVNPMLSIMALAWHVAQHMKADRGA